MSKNNLSLFKNAKFSSSNGSVRLYTKDIQDGLHSLGKNLVGSIFTNFYMGQGAREDWWEALHLPENDFINVYYIADAGASNAYNEGSPLYYDYKGTLKVLSDNSFYYPIMLTYKGEMPSEDYNHIKHVNYSKIVKFDPIKKVYK